MQHGMPIYLDYNATTPLHPEVVKAMQTCLAENFGNPSSQHSYGQAASRLIKHARDQVAGLLGCDTDEIIFTSGGTESDNHALKGLAWANRDHGMHIITSQIEHPAILNVCRFLQRHGFEISYVPVNSYGMLDMDAFAAAIRDDTILVSIMHANNEVGTLQPITDISKLCRQHGIALHCDASQSIGKTACSISELGVDMLTVAGHKLYGPKGVGALYVRHGINLEPLLHGAGHELGRRAGTENITGIVGLGRACELLAALGDEDYIHMQNLRDRLQHKLEDNVPDTRLNGEPVQRLANTLSLSFLGINANELLDLLAEKVAVSAGAACHGDKVTVSHVLQAMGVPEEWARGTIRFSLGIHTTELEIDQASELVSAAVAWLRRKKIGSDQT